MHFTTRWNAVPARSSDCANVQNQSASTLAAVTSRPFSSRLVAVVKLVENGLNGLLVPPREPRALAKAIEKLLREPQTAWRMGEASYERSREFTEQVMFERLGSLYQSLALERAGKRLHAAS